ncbi:MAG: hypothetical protein Q8S22_04860 [Eubacteriales bacterium]|nr:hypothetical protein [Eubacteriales bacterium]
MRMSVTISAAGVYGSSVSSISTTVNGATYSGNSFLTNALSTAGANTIRATITDSCGRTTTLTDYAVNGSYRIGGSLSNQYTYDIRVTLGDYFGEAYGYTDLSTAEVILSVRSTGM